MDNKRLGVHTVKLSMPPSILAGACVGGKKEGEGPLRHSLDYISDDAHFGESSWEKGESAMLKHCFSLASDKAKIPPSDLDFIFAGDLINQCVISSFALRDSGVPMYGLFGACSTMAEGLGLAAMLIDGGFARKTAVVTSSHFCTAERQFRFPLEYGGQRAPTSQWTVTGAGSVILAGRGPGPYITHVTTGKIVDKGITDANNMGAAMAPSAYETLSAHFSETGRNPSYYDLIVTGDLGQLGSDIVRDLFNKDGIELGPNYNDCGLMIFDTGTQDVGCGGSGCGCCATVLSGHILSGLADGTWNNVLFAATGALMSTTSSQQGESIPGICHAVSITNSLEA